MLAECLVWSVSPVRVGVRVRACVCTPPPSHLYWSRKEHQGKAAHTAVPLDMFSQLAGPRLCFCSRTRQLDMEEALI